MKKIVNIYYLEEDERASDYSRGLLLVLEDGSKLELMSTDTIADRLLEDNKE